MKMEIIRLIENNKKDRENKMIRNRSRRKGKEFSLRDKR